MVTPIWTEPATESVPKGIGTRFRLKYAEKNDKFLRSVVNEFEQLPDTTIFALRKLKKLNIAFEDVLGRNYMVSFEKRGDFNQSEIRLLSRISGQSDRHQDAETRIRVFRTPIPDPPLDTSSDDSSDDFSDDLSSNKARDVVVGFQVDPDSGEPIIPDHGQQVFAFLPVGRLPQLPVRHVSAFSRLCADHTNSSSFTPISLLPQIGRQYQRSSGTRDYVMVLQKHSLTQSPSSVKM